MITALLPPLWLIHVAVAAVWFYEGLWCKVLNGQPRQVRVVEAVPLYGPGIAAKLLKLLGAVETAVGRLGPDRNRSHSLCTRADFAACNVEPLRTAVGAPVN